MAACNRSALLWFATLVAMMPAEVTACLRVCACMAVDWTWPWMRARVSEVTRCWKASCLCSKAILSVSSLSTTAASSSFDLTFWMRSARSTDCRSTANIGLGLGLRLRSLPGLPHAVGSKSLGFAGC
eukprot:scaffold67667_cov66-Phaeocystis_antarctica.AAC.2